MSEKRIELSALNKPPTDAQIYSVCFSFRHDFGLLTQNERELMIFEARKWWKAITEEISNPSYLSKDPERIKQLIIVKEDS